MSRNVALFDSKGKEYGAYDDIVTLSYLEGHSPGVKAAVAWLQEQAVERFRRGEDKMATELRSLAREMHDKLVTVYKDQADKFRRDHPELE